MPDPLFRKIDCIRLPVPDLDAALDFYHENLGHEVVWRSERAVGLRFPDGEGEIVLHTEGHPPEVDLLVTSADQAAQRFVDAGGRLLAGPFDIQIGRCAVVEDPFGSVLVMLDMSKGRLVTGDQGQIIGNEPPS